MLPANNETLSLSPVEEDTGPKLSLTGERTTLPSDNVARQRAAKANFGLASASPGYETLFEGIRQGQEEALRMSAAHGVDLLNQRKKLDILNQMEAQRGGPVDPDEMNFILSASQESITQPFSVFEEAFAKEFMNHVLTANPIKPDQEEFRGIIGEMFRDAPEAVADMADVASNALATIQGFQKIGEDLQAVVNEQNGFGFAVDLAKFLVPFYYDYKLRDRIGEEMGLGPLWTGENIKKQRELYLSMPTGEAIARFKADTDELAKDNPFLAMIYAMMMSGATTEERWLDNVFQAVDITSVFGSAWKLARSGMIAKKIAKLKAEKQARGEVITKDIEESIKKEAESSADQAQKAVQDVVDGAAGPELDGSRVQAAVGDVEGSAVTQVMKNIAARGKEITDSTPEIFGTSEAHLMHLLSAMRTTRDNMILGSKGLTREAYTRLEEAATRDIDNIERLLQDLRGLDRLPPEALQAAVKAIQRGLKEEYKGLDNSFIDTGVVKWDNISNVYEVEHKLGDSQGTLFASQAEADLWAQYMNIDLKNSGIKILESKQQGNGWYISITKPVRETDDAVREALITTYNETPTSLVSTWIGFLRSPEDTLATLQRENRHVATYGPGVFIELMTEMAKDIRGVSKGIFTGKKSAKEFEDVLRLGSNAIDPDTKVPGYWFKNLGELEDAYWQVAKRNPTEQEAAAYFAYVRLNDFDHILRNAAVYRNKHRLGTQETKYSWLGADGKVVQSEAFDAIPITKLSFGAKANVLIIDNKTGAGKIRRLEALKNAKKDRKSLEEGIKDGTLKVVQVFDVDAKPFKDVEGVGGKRIHYVISNNFEHQPLGYNQVPRRGGGHVEYDYKYYIKQAKVRGENIDKLLRFHYEGDRTVMAIGTQPLGKDVVRHLNAVSDLLKKKDEAGAKAYLQSNTPIPWSEYKKWDIDINEPFYVVNRERSIFDIDPHLADKYSKRGEFVNATKDPHNPARQYSVAFTGERDSDLYSYADKGTMRNPHFTFEPAKTVSPIPMLNRAMSRIVHSKFMDDYKIGAIEQWAQEAARAGVLEASAQEVSRNPMFHFYNPKWKKGLEGTDKANALKVSQYQIQQFLGQSTAIDSKMQALNQKIVEGIYGKVGPKAAELVQNNMLPFLDSPYKYLRAMAFHSKLGLFNWTQLLVQMQTYAHILGVAGPTAAFPGMAASVGSRYLWMKGAAPEFVKAMDAKMSKLGWRPGEFAESHDALMSSGYLNILREHAMIDDATGANIVKGSFDRYVLDGGSWFFREGERQVRMGAWHTAYKEHRAKKPTGALTNRESREILSRADLLYANMSRASNSQIHRGIFSVPSQFLTYQLRIAEQFWGKRLTPQEKIRAFGTYGLLYGFPIATGVSGIPIADQIRQSGIEAGVDLNSNWLNSALNQGLPTVVMSLISGRDYNFGDRYGLQGFTTIREALWADREWWELLLGAGGSVVTDTIRESQPLIWGLTTLFSDDDTHFPLKSEDVVRAAGAISSVNNAWRGAIAMTTGIWESRKGRPLTDVQGISESLFMSATGLAPTTITEMHDKSNITKNLKDAQKKAADFIVRDLQRAFQAGRDNDPATARDYFQRSKALFAASGLQHQHKADILSRALSGYQTMVETSDWDWLKNVAQDDFKKAFDSVVTKQQREKQRVRSNERPQRIGQ